MSLVNIMQSLKKKIQAQKATKRLHFYEMSRIENSIDTESSLVVAKDWGREKNKSKVISDGYEIFLLGDKYVLKLGSKDSCTILWIH